jgi:putative phosphoesterase
VEAKLMRIGLLSDTHDRLPAIDALVREFLAREVSFVLHAGDFCAPFSLRPFLAHNVALAGVFGINDGDHAGLRVAAAQGMGVEIFEAPHSLVLGERKLLLVHELGDALDGSILAHDVVVHGHAHLASTATREQTLLVNPGEACGWLHGTPSAAILDLDSLTVESITLPSAEWTR